MVVSSEFQEENQKKYKITVITICYNAPDLKQTCESIVNQTYQDFEWIVVDGGSNEETLKIFNEYKNRINTFISEPDTGIYNAMNKGIKLANGKYLNFLNAGDYYVNNNVLSEVIEAGLDSDIVYGDLQLDKKRKKVIKRYKEKNDLYTLFTDSIPHPSSFIKYDLFLKYGLYDETYKILSDWDKWIVFVIKNNCKYKHINVVCSNFNLDGVSNTKWKELEAEREEILKKYFTKEEITNLHYEVKVRKFNMFERIFSLKNMQNYKIFTIMGISIKYKVR